jgi:hypothetical protein
MVWTPDGIPQIVNQFFPWLKPLYEYIPSELRGTVVVGVAGFVYRAARVTWHAGKPRWTPKSGQ